MTDADAFKDGREQGRRDRDAEVRQLRAILLRIVNDERLDPTFRAAVAAASGIKQEQG